MSTYYPPVQGPSGATGGLGSTQTGYQDPRRRRLQRPGLAGPAHVPPPMATGPYQQFQDIMREAALQRRMQGPAQVPGQYGAEGLPAIEPGMELPQEPVDQPTDTFGAGEEAAGLDFEQAFEALMRRSDEQARQVGVTEGNLQVKKRRASISDTVNEVSSAIQRRLAELTQGVFR